MPRMNINQSKQKMNFKSLKKIFAYCKPYFPAIIISIVCAVIASVTTIIGPEKISDLMNELLAGISTGVDMNAIVQICIFLVCLYLSGAIFSYIQQFIMAIVTQRSSKKLRTDINKKINKLPLAYFDTTTKGDILSRVTNDVDTISQTLGSSIANLVSSLVLFVGVTFKMFQTNWILALVTIVSSLIGFMLMGLILGKSQKYFVKRQQYLGEMNGHIEEIYTNHNIVKSYNGVNNEKANFAKNNNKIYNVEWKSQFLYGMMMPIMTFVGNLSYVLIFVVGVAIIVNSGSGVTIGTLIAFIIYARLFSQPLTTFAQSMQSLQQASAASDRVFEMLEAKELDNESHKTLVLDNIRGNIEFKDVKFGYTQNKEIIKGFSAKVRAGQKVAIVGPTGAGKTTIVNLLMRFYEVDSGDILIDGNSIKDMKRESVHDLFDMILQDTWLFSGTIRENLVYNKQGVTDEKLDKVCDAVGLSHFISTLEN
ncbi:MAG: ABC transporter ATP-binding protein, partial [Clostridia bacterium]|nr:ABC transporter ATP-binding protein [Clostridia bacterium]